MAPKRSTSAAAKLSGGGVIKKPVSVKLKAMPRAKRKSTKPFAAPTASSDGKLDQGLAAHNSPLYFRAKPAEDFDVRLVLIDVIKNIDKYFVMQIFEDPKVSATRSARYYLYKRWGNTGTGGQSSLVGPSDQAQIEQKFLSEFKSRTGAKYDELLMGEKAKPGKYFRASPMSVLAADASSGGAKWQFHTGSGWEPYPGDAGDQLELLWAENHVNKKHGGSNPTAARFVDSGPFNYAIDFDAMTQRNTKTGKERKLRRVGGSSGRASGTAASSSSSTGPVANPTSSAARRSGPTANPTSTPLKRSNSLRHDDGLGESLAVADAPTIPADFDSTMQM